MSTTTHSHTVDALLGNRVEISPHSQVSIKHNYVPLCGAGIICTTITIGSQIGNDPGVCRDTDDSRVMTHDTKYDIGVLAAISCAGESFKAARFLGQSRFQIHTEAEAEAEIYKCLRRNV